MANIDSIDEIKKLDSEGLLQNLQEFPDQCEKCWSDWKKLPLPSPYIQTKSILICGMGGSGIGGGLAAGLAKLTSKIPITIWSDYDLPNWVNKDTLVIAVSYSGNTEETITALKKAGEETEKIITISTGGKLKSLGSSFRALHYKIDYGSQPRAALGYLFTSILAIFNKLRILEISDEEFKEAIIMVRGLQKKIDANVSSSYNNAKILAQKLEGKIPVVYGAGTMAEVARRLKGEFNENAKSFSAYEIYPELNHNAFVGLDFPKDLSNKIYVLILESKYAHPRNKLRASIGLQILQQKGIRAETILMDPSPSALAELLETIHFGDYVSYYLAILNNIAPNPVDIIGYLKDKLAEKPLEEK